MRQLPIHRDFEANQSGSYNHLVLVDTDIGDDIDDALALALVLQSPEIELQGVTTVFGDTHQRARLAAYLLKVFGREDVPVAAGIQNPIQLRHRPSGVPQAAILDDRVALGVYGAPFDEWAIGSSDCRRTGRGSARAGDAEIASTSTRAILVVSR